VRTSRLRPADELVTIPRVEPLAWFEGRDRLEGATPKYGRFLVPRELHALAEAWVYPSCEAVSL